MKDILNRYAGFDPSPYSERVRPWDTFTMWYLLNKTEYKDTIKVGDFPSPDARWNFCMGQKPEELMGEDVIISHYTIKQSKNMRPISINSDLTRMLDDYINWFNKKDFDLPMDEKRFGDRDMEYYCSKEYLDHVMSESKKHRVPSRVCEGM